MLSHEDFLDVLDRSDVMVLFLGQDLKVVQMNQTVVSNLLILQGQQMMAGDYLGKPLSDLFPDEKACEWLLSTLRGVLDGTHPHLKEEMVMQAGGMKFYLEVQAYLKNFESMGPGLVLTLKDLYFEKKLIKQLQQAEDLFTFKEVLLGASNELNNLMTVISSSSDLIASRSEVSEQLREELGKVGGQIERARKIVANLLMLAKESRQTVGRLNLNSQIHNVFQLRQYEMTVNNLSFELLLNDIPEIAGDPHRVYQLILNILNHCMNSIIASGLAGVIKCYTGVEGESVRLSIFDDGPCFDEAELQRVFEPFFIPVTSERKVGMGLSVCRRIAEEHNGKIFVQNLSPRGVEFTVMFPITDVSDMMLAETQIFSRGFKFLAQRGKAEAKYKSIMVVDDEDGIREVLVELLESLGYKALTCSDGRRAVSTILKERPDAVISDIRMPFVNGKTLFETLRKLNPKLAANMLFITGDVVRSDSADFLRQNNLPHLNKPFTLDELVKALDYLAETEAERMVPTAGGPKR